MGSYLKRWQWLLSLCCCCCCCCAAAGIVVMLNNSYSARNGTNGDGKPSLGDSDIKAQWHTRGSGERPGYSLHGLPNINVSLHAAEGYQLPEEQNDQFDSHDWFTGKAEESKAQAEDRYVEVMLKMKNALESASKVGADKA